METFPGLTVRATAAGNECVRCNRDKHNPKVYSCENNMHPGPVPQELLVRYAIVYITYSLCCVLKDCNCIHCHCLLLYTGADTGGGNADLSSDANNVTLHATSEVLRKRR